MKPFPRRGAAPSHSDRLAQAKREGERLADLRLRVADLEDIAAGVARAAREHRLDAAR
jgi:hypothetical protein